MAQSINTVFVQLIVDVGIKQTAEVAKRLGITSIDLDKPVYGGIAIGTQEVSPLDMSSAFGVFAARGLRAEPTPVLKITQRDGTVLEDNTLEDRTTRVLEEPVADNMNKILTGVVEGGTGDGGQDRPAGGRQDRDVGGVPERLVRGLHADPLDRRLDGPQGGQHPDAGRPGRRLRGRRHLAGPAVARLHGRGHEGRARRRSSPSRRRSSRWPTGRNGTSGAGSTSAAGSTPPASPAG